ncbi:hypothetical protein EDB86DRAFT_3245208 [Lactarius hatsudake]|nr:hypothetical protein EDB86DRAFT_3245208 [Lactarius hatsudake]
MTLIGLFDRTFSSDLLSEPTKNRRAIICAKALDPAEFPYAYRQIADRILFDDRFRGLQTAEFSRAIRGWGGGGDREAALVRAIFVSIVARAQGHDEPWLIFASNEFGVPESDLRDYITRGDSWSLEALIHITCQQFHHTRNLSWPAHDFSKVLESASKFNVQNTSPETRHRFCSLWNQIVRDARRDNNRRMVRLILKPIYDVYTALHPVADSHPSPNGDGDYVPSSYPLCDIPDHHADSIPQAHDQCHNASASVSFAHIPLCDNTALPLAPLASPDAPSSSVSAPRPDVSSLAGHIYVPGPFNAARQTAVEFLRIPATSQNPVAVRVIQDGVDASTTAIPLSPMEHSTSTPPAPRPGVVAVQHIADRSTSSDVLLDVPSLPFPTPVLDIILPTEPHLSLIAPAASSRPHPRLSSARDLGAAAEGGGSAKATVRKRKEKDTRYPSSAIRKNIITTPDLPPQLPPPPLATASPSWRPLNAEHPRYKPPYPSHSHHDIV